MALSKSEQDIIAFAARHHRITVSDVMVEPNGRCGFGVKIAGDDFFVSDFENSKYATIHRTNLLCAVAAGRAVKVVSA